MPGARCLQDEAATTAFLRDGSNYPLFAKPADGKYSIAVASADAYDPGNDKVVLQDGSRLAVSRLAATLARRDAGFMLQRRLNPHPDFALKFGPRLWSVRLILLLTADGPLIHHAAAKIATGANPADNFWRVGNMLGDIDLGTSRIRRVVRGESAGMAVNERHPDTGQAILGTLMPDWPGIKAMAKDAGMRLPGLRTQSWDIELTDQGPVPLEVNFGGDLNLAQLASGAGVLDGPYPSHLRRCGYRGRL